MSGIFAYDGKLYFVISLLIVALSICFILMGYEKKVIKTRRMVIISIMIALSVVGRFIPFFKPVTAITIITAMYLGGEAGFLVGALSALISNFYFGQGPWTVFQMLGWGLIGLFAGGISKWLRQSKTWLLVYGVGSGILFSAIMDIWTVLWYKGGFQMELYLAALVTALPHTILYAVSNGIFLYFMAKPFGDKLNRIKVKYGI